MQELFLQCPTGISGDMLLAGLADLGVDFGPLNAAFSAAGLEVELATPIVRRHGLVGRAVELGAGAAQPLRHEADLVALIQALEVPQGVQQRACQAVARLAEAEAAVHGIARDKVHFHEVGAVDTVVDIVGAMWGLHQLGIERVTATALPWSEGEVCCEHGVLPVPAPATVQLLQGKPVRPTTLTGELVTPTGAVLVDQVVDAFVEGPCGVVLASGWGWGTRELEERPNALRAVLLRTPAPAPQTEEIWVLEANIDHLSGEEIGGLFEYFLDQGALDVLYVPAVMKKNRPGGVLQVLSAPQDLARLQDVFVTQSLTLGLRRKQWERIVVPRHATEVSTPWGGVQAKAAQSGTTSWVRPEYEALRALAEKTGRSVAQLRLQLGLQAPDDGGE
ncbi:MAG: nickel pincer cofactor biosynthesis protein LarC [Thermodesulfobacteriota bacterium]